MSDLLKQELEALGARECKLGPASVRFEGDLALAYRVCLWSRTASRVLMPLLSCEVDSADDIYTQARDLPWEEHLSPAELLAVHAHVHGGVLSHSQYASLRLKDAVCDRLRDLTGERPSIDPEQPDIRLYVHADGHKVELGLDLSGESLHRRGYRSGAGVAPIKENLAAALLLRAGWPHAEDAALVDLMCGSGTFLIEGAWMALDHAPGLRRRTWGFSAWLGHRPKLWEGLIAEAKERFQQARARAMPRHYLGRDHDAAVLGVAKANIAAAGLSKVVTLEHAELGAAGPENFGPGLVMVNPPYGERMDLDPAAPHALYRQLGEVFRRDYQGWRAAVLCSDPEQSKYLELRTRRINRFNNGDLACQLLRFDIDPRWYFTRPVNDATQARAPVELSAGASMFANRLRKNWAKLKDWAEREDISCYRLYDADLPEYALAVDIYQGEALWVHAQEYAPPASVPAERAEQRLAEALAVIPEVLGIKEEAVFLKQRRRQRGTAQYQRQQDSGDFHLVREGAASVWVNFTDYLDTGLFLDHRITRDRVAGLARGRHFLNLYAYTGVATVHAGMAGALTTTSVDLSQRYLDWLEHNLHANNLGGPAHRLVQADCAEWMAEQARLRRQWGVIFLDPPTFSNSKRMEGTLDVQRDHVELIRAACRLLEPDGVLVFSNNFRRFKLDAEALPDLDCMDISAATLPADFARNPRIHVCFEIRRKAAYTPAP